MDYNVTFRDKNNSVQAVIVTRRLNGEIKVLKHKRQTLG